MTIGPGEFSSLTMPGFYKELRRRFAGDRAPKVISLRQFAPQLPQVDELFEADRDDAREPASVTPADLPKLGKNRERTSLKRPFLTPHSSGLRVSRNQAVLDVVLQRSITAKPSPSEGLLPLLPA